MTFDSLSLSLSVSSTIASPPLFHLYRLPAKEKKKKTVAIFYSCDLTNSKTSQIEIELPSANTKASTSAMTSTYVHIACNHQLSNSHCQGLMEVLHYFLHSPYTQSYVIEIMFLITMIKDEWNFKRQVKFSLYILIWD